MLAAIQPQTKQHWSLLPRGARASAEVADAYTELFLSLGEANLVRPTYRPLSARNLLGFLYRLCGDRLRSDRPWSMRTLLDRYKSLRIRCQTTLAVRAHAHWISILVRCPGWGMVAEDDGGTNNNNNSVECTLARLRPLLSPDAPPPTRHSVAATLRQHAFSPEEVRRLHEAAASDPLDRLLLLLLLTTALRVGGLSRIPALTDTDRFAVTEEKGGQRFPVYLAPCVREALRAWWAVCPPRPGARYLFPARYDVERPVSTSYLKRRFRRLCGRAGVLGPHAHIHTTRHTTAVALRLAGCRIVDIQAFLGHANPSTTLAVYCTPDFHQLVDLLRLPWMEGGSTTTAHHQKTLTTTTGSPSKPVVCPRTSGDDTLLRALVPPDLLTTTTSGC